MNSKINTNLTKRTYRAVCRVLTAVIMMLTAVGVTHAFKTDTYAETSRLASGKWVKISVPSNGLYAISASQLKQWGFSEPEKVRVYGYGGNRIPDRLLSDNYVDDLPLAMQEYTAEHGLVFYGLGPETWEESSTRYFRQNLNVYSTVGYYFLSDTDEDLSEAFPVVGTPEAENPATKFSDRLFHEKDLVIVGEAGYLLVGEDFNQQRNYTFEFDLVDHVPETKVWMESSVITKTHNEQSLVTFTVNGSVLPTIQSDYVSLTPNQSYYHGSEGVSRRLFDVEGDRLSLNVALSNSSTVLGAWLNYLALNYTRHLSLPAKTGSLVFYTDDQRLQLSGAAGMGNVRVWDVTNVGSPQIMNISAVSADGKVEWTTPNNRFRTYAAWTDKSAFQVPTFVENVVNQDLHALQGTDMVIFTLPELSVQAERIANMHRNDEFMPLSVHVLNVNEVYNEFASGSGDVSALRKCLKMFYDRGHAADSVPTVKYALIMGRSTYDNRHITSGLRSLGYKTVPQWLGGTVKTQLTDNEGFGTDDFIAMLADGSGLSMGIDSLCVAVGRLPMRNATEAKSYVDKLVQYQQRAPKSSWKNSFMLLADDEDDGVHMEQTEVFVQALSDTPDQQHIFNKVYMDAFTKKNSAYPEAREKMFYHLNEGVVWWNYVGHANNHSWSHDGQLTYTDILNMYLTHVPVLFAATCDFLRWDSNTLSGGEIMLHERYGGSIAMISATRPVYISDNGYFVKALGSSVLKRDENGMLRPLGEIYRTAKNNIRNKSGIHVSNPNRLRYVLMGDPAMRLVTPSNTIVLETIAGKDVNPDSGDSEQLILAAMQQAEITGRIVDTKGETMEAFDGVVTINLYDADNSVTSKGNGDNGKKVTFDQMGNKLYAGSTNVKNGRFSLKISMPADVADNFRPATMNMYAYATNSSAEAVGVNRDFYVFGYDESAPVDTIAPVIKSLVLNSDDFKNGDTVNESPLLIAEIGDETGLNLAMGSIGHSMTVTIDEKKTFTDVSLHYNPTPDDVSSGTINYPLEKLSAGNHTITLKIWDTSGNSATGVIDFYVKPGLAPEIFDVFTTSSPAKTQADFYLKHNRPNAMLTVKLSVYTLGGKPVWSNSVSGMSDMFLSAPVTWDLNDAAGRRVPRGIYVYRAEITSDGQSFSTASRKIAVAGE